MSDKSYVYEDVEVVKTKREAIRTLSSGKPDVRVEITPKHDINGIWKKWVKETELFTIVGDKNETV